MGCHAQNVDPEGGAPYFANIKYRLRPDWVVTWLKDPGAIMPGTRMPQLWLPINPDDPKTEHQALPGFFGDKAQVQMEKVRDYIFQLQEKTELPVAPLHDPDAPRPLTR